MDYIDLSLKIPKVFIYDDACHLKKYVTNKASDKFDAKSDRGKRLSNSLIVCDRFHFLTHVDDWCRANCDPDLYPVLENVNTSVCEQTNMWFGGFKHMFKHMNYSHFHFTLYILADEYNKNQLIHKEYELKIKYNKFDC